MTGGRMEPGPTHRMRPATPGSLRRLLFQGLIWGGFIVWLPIYLWTTIPQIQSHWSYYRFALGASSEAIRSSHVPFDSASSDFPRILQFCDEVVPPGSGLQILLPRLPLYRYEYLRDKARYLLYPKNYGNNDLQQDFILVYEVAEPAIPDSYRILKRFAPNKVLWVREGTGRSGARGEESASG